MPDPAGPLTPAAPAAPVSPGVLGASTAPALASAPGADSVASSAPVLRSKPDELLSGLAQAVLAVDGVVRLEPTLSTAGPRVLLCPSPTDGIRLITRAGVVDVDISLATSTDHEARAVTHQVQRVVAELLVRHGYTKGSVAVSVLAISPTMLTDLDAAS